MKNEMKKKDDDDGASCTSCMITMMMKAHPAFVSFLFFRFPFILLFAAAVRNAGWARKQSGEIGNLTRNGRGQRIWEAGGNRDRGFRASAAYRERRRCHETKVV